MSDKQQIAWEQILQKIESGRLPGGTKLPAAREFSDELGVSLTITQLASNSLIRDGILYTVPRKGTYVRQDWRDRILPGSFRSFRPIWSGVVQNHLISRLPQIRSCDRFREGVFEIRATWDAQWKQEEYLDLSELLDEIYPDRSDFFQTPFQAACSRTGKLYGIPLIFSPWVICCNIRMIEEAGGTLPRPGWLWDDFLELIRVLRRKYPANEVFQFGSPNFFLSFLLRAGGGVITGDGSNYDVILDDPRSIDGLRKLKELREQLEDPGNLSAQEGWGRVQFQKGNVALMGASREDVDFNSPLEWITVPLPLIPGGVDRTRLAGDLLCVRRQANDFELIREVIRKMLSPEIQNIVGKYRYGIPIRRSSAIQSVDETDPRDVVFFSEMLKIAPDHSLAWPDACRLLMIGLGKIWHQNAEPEQVVSELAPTLRTLIHYFSGTITER